MDLATTHEITLVPFTSAQQQLLTQRYSYYSAYELAADSYRGVTDPVPTLSVWNVIVCHAELPPRRSRSFSTGQR